jgi:membrane-associated protease RseP (regulator of RpoE activity)
MKKLTSLTEQKTGKELKEYVSQNYEPIKSMAVGKGSGDAMVELDRAYVAASPFLQVRGDVITGTKEVGVEIEGGEVHVGGDMIGGDKIIKKGPSKKEIQEAVTEGRLLQQKLELEKIENVRKIMEKNIGPLYKQNADILNKLFETPPAVTERPSKPYGMSLENLTPQLAIRFGYEEEKSGVVVSDVEADLLAEMSGIQPGDLIKEVNGEKISNLQDFHQLIEQSPKGKGLSLLVKRGSNSYNITLTH